MSIATYDDLKTTVADFLNRDDLTSVIDTFIDLTEADINRKVRHWRMENRASASVTTRYSAIPTDFLEPIRLHMEKDHVPLENVSSYKMQELRQAGNDVAGTPKYYAITQGEIELYPSPNVALDLEMYYYARVPALNSVTTTNVILEYHPDIYLYGTLTHSAPYLAEDARTSVWASLYANALESARTESEKAKHSGSGLRMTMKAF